MHPLYKDILERGEPALEALVTAGQAEAVDVEFKLKEDPSNGAFSATDRRNLGKMLSAFANSAGGILIFGVRATRVEGVDCASALSPIRDIDRFSSEASALVGQLLMPRHDGIVQTVVRSASDATLGYLALDIGRSERRPHQSKAPKDGLYYKRAGDSTFAMEHYDIEDAFRRNAGPLLDLSWELRTGGVITSHEGVTHRLSVIISLRNEGVASARFPFIHIKDISDGKLAEWGLDGNGNNGLPFRRLGDWNRFEGGADTIIPPTLDLPIMRINFERQKRSDGTVLFNGRARYPDISFETVFGADGMRPLATHFNVLRRELADELERQKLGIGD